MFLHLLPADPNVICKDLSPWRLLHNLICQPLHHHSNKKGLLILDASPPLPWTLTYTSPLSDSSHACPAPLWTPWNGIFDYEIFVQVKEAKLLQPLQLCLRLTSKTAAALKSTITPHTHLNDALINSEILNNEYSVVIKLAPANASWEVNVLEVRSCIKTSTSLKLMQTTGQN